MVKGISLYQIRNKAEEYYRNGDFYCSESVVKTIRDEFSLPISDDAIAMASGFPVGIGGAGCICGAVSGGVMAIGMVFGRKEAKDEKVNMAMALSKELHDAFKDKHNITCCRVLTKGMEKGSPEHLKQCIFLTGEVAEETAKIIARELKIDINK